MSYLEWLKQMSVAELIVRLVGFACGIAGIIIGVIALVGSYRREKKIACRARELARLKEARLKDKIGAH